MSDCEEQESGEATEVLDGMTLFGFPIIWTENMPVGDIIFTDWRSYLRVKFKEEGSEPEGGE